MTPHELANWLIEPLPYGREGLFNPWRESCSMDAVTNGPTQRFERLVAHLSVTPRLVLVGEAPGYQGCRYSGIAFTSERLLLEGAIPRIHPSNVRLSQRNIRFSEPSATHVWRALYAMGMAESTVLWNALQLHPYKAGKIWSNRTPTPTEIALGRPSLLRLREAFPEAHMVAVGRKAEGLLADAGIDAWGVVRHPAYGGATAFSDGLKALIAP